jgi:hypothetical protein
MSFAPKPARRIVCLAMLLAVAVALLPGAVLAYNGATCAAKWPQDRLAISPNLKTRHFVLEPLDDVQQLPPFLEPGARRIFLRAFSLSLDAAEPIGIYRTSTRRTCVVARDDGHARPIRVPVFFIGRDGQPAPELKEDAERTAFARTSSLTDVEDFTGVRFHLRKGGWSFPYIEPFFACGLPGLMLCEGSCPTDLTPLAQSLLDWVLKGETWPMEAPDVGEPAPKAKPGQPAEAVPFPRGSSRRQEIAPSPAAPGTAAAKAPTAAKQDCPPAPPAAPAVAASKPAEETVPAIQPRQKPAVEPPLASGPAQRLASEPRSASGPAQKPVSEPPVAFAPAQKPMSEPLIAAVPEPKPAVQPRALAAPPQRLENEPPAAAVQEPRPAAEQAPSVEPPAGPPQRQEPLLPPSAELPAGATSTPQRQEPPASPSAAPPATRQFVLGFERKNGAAIDAGEILQAEGSVSIKGTAAARVAGDLVVTLPEEALAEAARADTLGKALPHYQVLGVRTEEARTVVTAEPLFIRASDLKIKVASSGNENVSGCDLALDVLQSRRLGSGWPKTNVQTLRFREVGQAYALILPLNADRNSFLIATGQNGSAARVLSLSSGCKLEARPFVSAEEIGSGTITRNLQEMSGQVLIALLSTDSNFSDHVGAVAEEGFWAAALSLAASVSEGAWERKVLGRAQFPGSSPETGWLDSVRGGKLAAGTKRDDVLKTLIEGSRQDRDYLPQAGSKPIQRFGLNTALEIVRHDASIVPREGLPREGLLLITGGVDPAGGFFCRHPSPPDTLSPAAAQWVSGARRIFALEVWSEASARSLEKVSRAAPAEAAPPGIYSCNFPAHDASVALYGVLPGALSTSARDATFAYLTARANSFLRP